MASRAFTGTMVLEPSTLSRISADVLAAASYIARASGDQMASALRRAYPSITDDLRKGVTVSQSRDGAVKVRTTASHATAYERGTPPRFRGNASTGRMPRANVFVPLAMRTRRGLYRDLQSMLNQHREIG